MEVKVCRVCKEGKTLDQFHNNKNAKDSKQSVCKLCGKYQKIEYRNNNKDKINYYRLINREKILNYLKLYSKQNNEKHKLYLENNKEYLKNKDKEYRITNKNDRLEYYKNKRLYDPLFKLKSNIRCGFYNSFKNKHYSKKTKTSKILGCSFEEFKLYLESKFESWMNWNNYGLYNGELNYGWDIDHIIPLSSSQTEGEIIKLNHFSNLQPLCSKINRDIKRNKLNYGE